MSVWNKSSQCDNDWNTGNFCCIFAFANSDVSLHSLQQKPTLTTIHHGPLVDLTIGPAAGTEVCEDQLPQIVSWIFVSIGTTNLSMDPLWTWQHEQSLLKWRTITSRLLNLRCCLYWFQQSTIWIGDNPWIDADKVRKLLPVKIVVRRTRAGTPKGWCAASRMKTLHHWP